MKLTGGGTRDIEFALSTSPHHPRPQIRNPPINRHDRHILDNRLRCQQAVKRVLVRSGQAAREISVGYKQRHGEVAEVFVYSSQAVLKLWRQSQFSDPPFGGDFENGHNAQVDCVAFIVDHINVALTDFGAAIEQPQKHMCINEEVQSDRPPTATIPQASCRRRKRDE
jgi:hypothetical protein